ncbi:Hypothetical predicted protein [Olea europaea subsp. europaea]|uniref:Uncharacterized protein n=1 Tax=Olea europaea subsp. europaea TaxID=158383 RepID=A0A8S0T7A7_OLEEU|nr:Hypothetical predicted protein [Olea europaea subsp. europaea]
MSMIGCGRYSILQILKGHQECTEHHKMCDALLTAGPYLQLSHFQGGPTIRTDVHLHSKFWSDRGAVLLIRAWRLPRRSVIGRMLQRHPFLGLVDLTDEVSTQLGTVTRLSVHPTSLVLLTKNGPFGALNLVTRLNEAVAPSSYLKRTICTSVSLRASTRVSSGFTLLRHSSPSFRSPQASTKSAEVSMHAEGMRYRQNRGDDIPRACRLLELWPLPQFVLVHAPSQSSDQLFTIPHPIGTHRLPLSASLSIISTLDGIYHPTTFLNNPTRQQHLMVRQVEVFNHQLSRLALLSNYIWATHAWTHTGGQCPTEARDPTLKIGTEGDDAYDAQADMPSGVSLVQKLEGSWDSTIHSKYHILLCSSSMQEPKYPLLRVHLISSRTLSSRCRSRGFFPMHALYPVSSCLSTISFSDSFVPPDWILGSYRNYIVACLMPRPIDRYATWFHPHACPSSYIIVVHDDLDSGQFCTNRLNIGKLRALSYNIHLMPRPID